jgi:hypothetical protein
MWAEFAIAATTPARENKPKRSPRGKSHKVTEQTEDDIPSEVV